MSDETTIIRAKEMPVVKSLRPDERQINVLKHSEGAIILEIKPENICVLLPPQQAKEFAVCILKGLGHIVDERQLQGN